MSTKTWHEAGIETLDRSGNNFVGLAPPNRMWMVKSDSDPMLFYYVMRYSMAQLGQSTWVCTCEGFRFSKNSYCKHIDLVRNSI